MGHKICSHAEAGGLTAEVKQSEFGKFIRRYGVFGGEGGIDRDGACCASEGVICA